MRVRYQRFLEAADVFGIPKEDIDDFIKTFNQYDKQGKLNHEVFKACMCSLGYNLRCTDKTDPNFERMLNTVDRERTGWITLEQFMAYLISANSNVGQSTSKEPTLPDSESSLCSASGKSSKSS